MILDWSLLDLLAEILIGSTFKVPAVKLKYGTIVQDKASSTEKNVSFPDSDIDCTKECVIELVDNEGSTIKDVEVIVYG